MLLATFLGIGGGGLVVGGGGFDVGAAEVFFTVGLTGTMGFSVSVLGTGGHTRFSNLTVDEGVVSAEGVVGGEVAGSRSSGPAPASQGWARGPAFGALPHLPERGDGASALPLLLELGLGRLGLRVTGGHGHHGLVAADLPQPGLEVHGRLLVVVHLRRAVFAPVGVWSLMAWPQLWGLRRPVAQMLTGLQMKMAAAPWSLASSTWP